jgi:L-lactate dehydrogenase complex protein LldF
MHLTGKVLAKNSIYNFSGKAARWALKNMPRKLIYNRINTWGRGRELPEVPKESCKEWYKKNNNGKGGKNVQG